MEVIKHLLSSQTPTGRVVRTFIQAFIGLCVAVVSVLSFPQFSQWFESLDWVQQAGGLAAVITIVTAIQNFLEKIWDSTKEY